MSTSIQISSRLLSIKLAATFAMQARARELAAQGRDIISLANGEPDFGPPQHILEAVHRALDSGHAGYIAVDGLQELKASIVKKLEREQKIKVTPQQIVVTNGGKQAISLLLGAIINPGDEVIIFSPYWTSYPDMVQLWSGTPKFVEAKPAGGFIVKPEDLEAALTPRTRAIILNSPSNPAGSVYSKAQLESLAEVVRQHKGNPAPVIIADEVYEYAVFDGQTHVSICEAAPDLADQIVHVNSFSKSYAVPGYRVGYAAGPLHLMKQLITAQSQMSSNVCSIAQAGCVAAYSDGGAFPQMMNRSFEERRNLLVRELEEVSEVYLAAIPGGSFFAFLLTDRLVGRRTGDKQLENGSDVANYLLEEAGVASVQGDAFGNAQAIRICFAVDEKRLIEALTRMKTAFKKIN